MSDGTDSKPLVVGISTRAVFDLEEEHKVFETQGIGAYAELQRARERQPLKPGAAFGVVQRLLNLNEKGQGKVVDIVLLSRNSPDLSLRAFYSFEEHSLPITRGSFTSGRAVAPFATAWGADLFLSNDLSDVREAISSGVAAAQLGAFAEVASDGRADEVRFAFDGDAVVFSEESDKIYAEQGLDAFLAHERMHATEPMPKGPFGATFLPKLARLRERFMQPDGSSLVRIAIVTARNAPAHERVVHTLRAWGTPADEAHFVGTHDKSAILKAFKAHIFFDDQARHVDGASRVVVAGLVPGPHDPLSPVIPSSE